jgi:hypothetical protein
MQRAKWWLIACIALSVVACSSEANSDVSAVKVAANTFLQTEFDGSGEPPRQNLITFSPKRQAVLDQISEPGVGPYELDIFDQAFIVKSFAILDCKVAKDKATVTVAYQRLARVENFNTSDIYIIPEKIDRDLVTLNLVFKKNKWWVLDPPPPRISKDVLILNYEEELKEAAENTPRWNRVSRILTSLKLL